MNSSNRRAVYHLGARDSGLEELGICCASARAVESALPLDKKALWLRLKAYEFDHLVPPSLWQQVVEAFGGADAATKAFADKLARKLGWSTPFALKAVAEYRKFVYLGMVSDFPVTPSKVIDQVWHEHQLFTQGYRRFCSEILGRHFDHHPELMPADRTARDLPGAIPRDAGAVPERVQSGPAAGHLARPQVSGDTDRHRWAPAKTDSVVERRLRVR